MRHIMIQYGTFSWLVQTEMLSGLVRYRDGVSKGLDLRQCEPEFLNQKESVIQQLTSRPEERQRDRLSDFLI
jgi:hypothetical protein